MLRKVMFLIGLLASSIIFQNCYSIRVKTQHGGYEAIPPQGDHPFYKDKAIECVDTLINLKVWEENGSLNLPCQKGLYSIEYKVTTGNALINMITFGRKKRVKVTYVCIEE